MPIFDFVCDACGTKEEDLYYKSVPRLRVCKKCDGAMRQDFSGKRNFIHTTISTLYGRPEPALGGDCFESYEHKKKLLKEWDMMEGSDPVKGARTYMKPKPERSKVQHSTWGNDPS